MTSSELTDTDGPGPTRAFVLHPDIRADRDRRPAVPALEEAVALAAALPDLQVVGAEIVGLPKAQPGLLFGTGKIAEKVGEEAVETVIAALSEGPDALASESADLLYHLCVLWADAGLKPEDIWAKLAAREGVSGLTEKANRKS